ncbi:MAG: PKD domain-containing protein, partial [Bacteroidetes bacterium]
MHNFRHNITPAELFKPPTIPKTIALLAAFLLASLYGQALHIKGGWMYYEYVREGNNGPIYNFVVKVYRDCNTPNPGQNDTQITISFFRNADNSFLLSASATLLRQYNLDKTSFNECINPRPRVCYVILEYRGTVELPASAAGYTASFQRCCRISGIVNITPPTNSLGNTYTMQVPGTRFAQDGPKNSSPVFSERDTVVVCFNSSFELDYSAIDPDGDSLTYEFTAALNGAGQSNPSPTISLPPPYPPLPYNSGFSDLNAFGTGVSINRRTGIITGISPNTSGEYVVAVTVREFRNGQPIAVTRKELHVNVAPCTLVGAQLPETLTNCQNYTVAFENLSASPAVVSYYWDFGVVGQSGDTSTAPTPSFTYPDTGVYRVKLVVNRASSCADSAFSTVRIFPGFTPAVRLDGACFLNPFLFADASTAAFGTVNYWRWDFGNPAATNDTSRLRNTSYSYSTPGVYKAELEVGTSKGCLDTLRLDVAVLDKPLLRLPFRDTLICSIDSLPLVALGTGSFSWLPNTRIINANTATPTVFPITTTVYRVTLADRGCVGVDSIRVNVLDFITVDAGPDTTICRTDAAQLRPTTQGLGFRWSPQGSLSNPNIKNPIATPTNATTTYTVLANLGKCPATDSVTIRTVPYPLVNAGLDTTICFGEPAFLRGSTNGSTWQWSPATFTRNSTQLFTTTNNTQTTSFTLRVTDTLGCPKPATDVVVVTVTPKIVVNAGRDTSIVVNQPLQLNGATNGSVYSWTPANILNNANVLDPIAGIRPDGPLSGEDVVRLVLRASNTLGCNATDDILVRVFKTAPSIFVPTGFTPNGDGLNDV